MKRKTKKNMMQEVHFNDFPEEVKKKDIYTSVIFNDVHKAWLGDLYIEQGKTTYILYHSKHKIKSQLEKELTEVLENKPWLQEEYKCKIVKN